MNVVQDDQEHAESCASSHSATIAFADRSSANLQQTATIRQASQEHSPRSPYIALGIRKKAEEIDD